MLLFYQRLNNCKYTWTVPGIVASDNYINLNTT